jgi:hypothetical protein
VRIDEAHSPDMHLRKQTFEEKDAPTSGWQCADLVRSLVYITLCALDGVSDRIAYQEHAVKRRFLATVSGA